MPCINISSLLHTPGRAIAERVASRLGYELVEKEVFEDAAAASGLPEEKLRSAFCDPPSFFGMSAATRTRSGVLVSAALARRFLKDNVVYHGPFGHLLIQGVSHVLRVRIVALRADRVAAMVRDEGSLSSEEAEKAVVHEDRLRLSLAKLLFNTDDEEATLSDVVINTSQVDPETAADIIISTARLPRYQPMTYSLRSMKDLEVALRVRASLMEIDADVRVEAKNGDVHVRTRLGGGSRGRSKLDKIRQRAASLEGVKDVHIEVAKDLFTRY